MSNVYLFIGTVGSGKSTAALQLIKEEGCIVINDDAIVNSIHGGDYTLYEKRLKPLYKGIENYIFTTAIALHESIIIDRGVNMTIDSRRRWIGMAHSLDVDISAIVFPIKEPEWHLQRRSNSKDGLRGLSPQKWLENIKYHIKSYEKPTFKEGFDDIFSAEFVFGKEYK